MHVDFNLHDLARIRLLNPTPGDVEAVKLQLGPIQQPFSGEPDILVRFVDHLSVAGHVRYLGLDEAGFTDDAFLVLRSKHKTKARVKIAFDQIGQQCEIVCESGLAAVPLLIPILNLTVLARGALPLHASAFVYKGKGVLTTGWSKGGKTETLLAFMERGAQYIGDEWVYITSDGKRMYGIPEPIRLWDWHLQQLPHYRALVEGSDRARLRTMKLAMKTEGVMPKKIRRRMVPLLKRQLYVDIRPQKLFKPEAFKLAGELQKVFFVASSELPEVTIRPTETQEIARRMVFSLQYERLNFMSYYWMYRFAFPEARNELIENAEALQWERLTQVLAGKEAYAVDHPYPVSFADLFNAIRPYAE